MQGKYYAKLSAKAFFIPWPTKLSRVVNIIIQKKRGRESKRLETTAVDDIIIWTGAWRYYLYTVIHR